MGIEGKKRENNFSDLQPKYIGLFEGRVIAVNPSPEEFEEMLGNPPKEDSKLFEYLGESKDGNINLRVDIWVEDIKSRIRKRKEEEEVEVDGKKVKKVTWIEYGEPVKEKFRVTFYLEDKEREDKDQTKKQYINNIGYIGPSSWAADPNDLPDWFKSREYRVSYQGEENFYKFMKTWFSKFDFKNSDEFLLEWKKFMKGNVKEVRECIGSDMSDVVGFLAYIETVDKDGEIKEYQKIYNKAFLYPGNLKFFRTIDYEDSKNVDKIKLIKPRDIKYYDHKKFVLDVKDSQYGCKGFYKLVDLKEYDPAENITASEKVIEADDASY